ncbi:hypothetical protein J1N35_000722 [Gossypium stocksii]|uniref:RNase H type-1 domain-containing protein n=1 Tax=Gossypium stocksii TaxID=47602 RepID=A0A9D3WIM7_9ROSI|nr:hypothetical protein J1N35_000722 [Gossypium stocksii]
MDLRSYSTQMGLCCRTVETHLLEGLREIEMDNDFLALIDTLESARFLKLNSGNILCQDNSWFLRYILREHNAVADCLAKEALASSANLQFFEPPPDIVQNFLEEDRSRAFVFDYMSVTI